MDFKEAQGSLGSNGDIRILIMRFVSQMYTAIEIHQIRDMKWIEFIVQKLYLNKLLKKIQLPSILNSLSYKYQAPRPRGEDSCVSDLLSEYSQKKPARE